MALGGLLVVLVLLGTSSAVQEVEMIEDDLSEVGPVYEKHRQRQKMQRSKLDASVAKARDLAKIAFDTRKRPDVDNAKAALLKVQTQTEALMKSVRTIPKPGDHAMASVKVKSHPKGSISYPALGIKMGTKKADGLMAPTDNAKKAWGTRVTKASQRAATEAKSESSSTFSHYGMLNRILSTHGNGRGFGKVSVSGKNANDVSGKAALAKDLNKAKSLMMRASKTLRIVKQSEATQEDADNAGAQARFKYNERMSKWQRRNDRRQRMMSFKRLSKISSVLEKMSKGFKHRPGTPGRNRRKVRKLNKKMNKIRARAAAKTQKSRAKLDKTLRRITKAEGGAPTARKTVSAAKKAVKPPVPRTTSPPASPPPHVKFNSFKKSRAEFKQLSKQAFDAAKRLHKRANNMQPKEEVSLGDGAPVDANEAVRLALRATQSWQGAN